MKKIVLILVAIGLNYVVIGQNAYELSQTHSKQITSPHSSNTKAIKQKLDSVVYDENSKYEYFYGMDGNNTLTFGYNWNVNDNNWEYYLKEEYTFDVNTNVTSYQLSFWNSESNNWIPYNKEEYTYNAHMKTTSHLSQTWDQYINDWINDSRYDFMYDANQNLTQRILIAWDAIDNQYRYDYFYDLNNNDTAYIFYIWNINSSEWEETRKEVNIMGVHGNIDTTYNYTFDTNNLWIYSYKYIYEYGNHDKLAGFFAFTWNKEDQIWVGNIKYDYTYDSDGNQNSEIFYSWNLTDWIPNSKTEKEYDSTQNNTITIQYMYNGGWIPSVKSESVYNPAFLSNEILIPQSIQNEYSYYNNQISSMKTFIYQVGNWELANEKHYYYSNTSVSIADQQLTGINLYPNPAKNTINVDKGENKDVCVFIYNMMGQLLLQKTLNRIDSQIDISNLQKGMYIINIKNEKGNYLKKFVKN
jgi:hypothetical protein